MSFDKVPGAHELKLVGDGLNTVVHKSIAHIQKYFANCFLPSYSFNYIKNLELSGPLNRLNAILSLLQPLDRYRAPSAIGSAIGRPYLALSRFHAKVGALNRLVLNRFRGSTAR